MRTGLIFATLAVLLISLIFLAVYFFSPTLIEKKLPFQPASKTSITPAQTENQQEGKINVLSLPGWPSGHEFFSRQPDGSVQIKNEKGSTELTIVNRTTSIPIASKGFEAIVKMHTVPKTIPDHPAAGFVRFYNKPLNAEKGNPLRLQIGLNSKNALMVEFINPDIKDINKRFIYLVTQDQNIKPSSGTLKIVMAVQEVSIYDSEAGKALVEGLQLPTPFFSENDNQLFVGFYPVSYDTNEEAVMTVSKFEITTK